MGLEFWANISVVWLALLCFIGLLIPLAAAYFAIRGMNFALDKSRGGLGAAQGYSRTMRERVDSLSQKIAKPVIKAESEVAKAEEVLRTLAKHPDR